MYTQYLGHSGFLVETANAFYVFDFIKGDLSGACLDNCVKPVFFLVSHFHADHFEPRIFQYRNILHEPMYLLSKDTVKKIKRSKKHLSEYEQCNVTCVSANETYRFGKITIETLLSTDEGVAFLIREPEGVIYHAGDLNWWDWPGEDEMWNKQMAGNFKKEISKLADTTIDLAFLPLDPRQGSSYWKGMQYFLSKVAVREVYPMHFWDQSEIITRYQREHGHDKKKMNTVIKTPYVS